ncbi:MULTISPECIES: hypothetical protein [Streptomyces]|uniref:hypothetical protein n=1 Tax=Streptomyces TaxID=1883 RepID=UPI001FCB7DDC|nr:MULTISPECIES: hypothetical protein [Streptomyces]MCL7490504.1 hypothetical protein [Streptomyces sp. MCA2]BDH14280.1 hypothetical protein HOK021_54590 [Streptomyces hygroscopicus]
MSEGEKNEWRSRQAVRVGLFVCGVLLAGVLVLSVAWWVGWWTPGFGWLSARLAAKAVVGLCLGFAALVAWVKKRA